MATIVVAEDDPILRFLMKETLELAGHEVTAASQGALALERILDMPPALVITDFDMPVMTGLGLAQAMQTHSETVHIPIILVTGAHGALARQYEHHFGEIIDKPFTNTQLFGAVDRLLSAPQPD